MASAASSFRSSASRPSTSPAPPCTWPNPVIASQRSNPWRYKEGVDCFVASLLAMTEEMETYHVERNSPRHHPPRAAHTDHGPRLSPRHDRDRGRDLSKAGAGQPDRERRQGGRLGPDRAGIQGPEILPWPALGPDRGGSGRGHQNRFRPG